MKRVSRILLKENAEILGKDEMKLIMGGSYYCCCRAQGSSSYDCSNYIAETFYHALYDVGYVCGNGTSYCDTRI